MAKDYWLIERKFKDGDKYFISDVKYSEKNKLLKEVEDGSYSIVGYCGSEDVFSMYCSKVKGTIE